MSKFKNTTKEREFFLAQTREHQQNVNRIMNRLAQHTLELGCTHDDSKLQEPEAAPFQRATVSLDGLSYGTPEYAEALAQLEADGQSKALTHHYEHNDHHPEFFENGVDDMTLIDIIHMVSDWYAATKRHEDGDIRKSIEINKERFNLSDQLCTLMLNTVDLIENLNPEVG